MPYIQVFLLSALLLACVPTTATGDQQPVSQPDEEPKNTPDTPDLSRLDAETLRLLCSNLHRKLNTIEARNYKLKQSLAELQRDKHKSNTPKSPTKGEPRSGVHKSCYRSIETIFEQLPKHLVPQPLRDSGPEIGGEFEQRKREEYIEQLDRSIESWFQDNFVGNILDIPVLYNDHLDVHTIDRNYETFRLEFARANFRYFNPISMRIIEKANSIPPMDENGKLKYLYPLLFGSRAYSAIIIAKFDMKHMQNLRRLNVGSAAQLQGEIKKLSVDSWSSRSREDEHLLWIWLDNCIFATSNRQLSHYVSNENPPLGSPTIVSTGTSTGSTTSAADVQPQDQTNSKTKNTQDIPDLSEFDAETLRVQCDNLYRKLHEVEGENQKLREANRQMKKDLADGERKEPKQSPKLTRKQWQSINKQWRIVTQLHSPSLDPEGTYKKGQAIPLWQVPDDYLRRARFDIGADKVCFRSIEIILSTLPKLTLAPAHVKSDVEADKYRERSERWFRDNIVGNMLDIPTYLTELYTKKYLPDAEVHEHAEGQFRYLNHRSLSVTNLKGPLPTNSSGNVRYIYPVFFNGRRYSVEIIAKFPFEIEDMFLSRAQGMADIPLYHPRCILNGIITSISGLESKRTNVISISLDDCQFKKFDFRIGTVPAPPIFGRRASFMGHLPPLRVPPSGLFSF